MGAPLALPTFATVQFGSFFDCGRAVRCMLPLGFGRFMHLVVFFGYQGADNDAEQLALTEQLFDAALGEVSVVARGQPCFDGWGFQRGAHQNYLAWEKGFRLGSGLTLRRPGLWQLVCNQPHTCKRDWHSAIALLLLLFFPARFSLVDGLLLILLLGLFLTVAGGLVGLLSLCRATHPLACLLVACC